MLSLVCYVVVHGSARARAVEGPEKHKFTARARGPRGGHDDIIVCRRTTYFLYFFYVYLLMKFKCDIRNAPLKRERVHLLNACRRDTVLFYE